MTGEAVAAAVAVARDFGVSVIDPVVLADGSNVLVHLRPAPVVARVAKLTAEVRPGVEAWLARDIALSAHVVGRGVPAVRPSVDPPAGPHHRDGRVLAFFEYVPHDPDPVPEPVEVARALVELHAALVDFPGALPEAGPVDDLRRGFDLLESERIMPDGVVPRLRADLERLAVEIAAFPVRVLHGDAHPGNLLWTPNGLVWNDFEDTWRGPLGWDLACLATSGYLDGKAPLAAYPGLPPADELDVCVRLRTLFAVPWRYLLDARFPGRAPDKRVYLDRWLNSE
jgi:hypothetical protein